MWVRLNFLFFREKLENSELNSSTRKQLPGILLSMLFGSCVLLVGFGPSQSEFLNIAIPYFLGFGCYLVLISGKISVNFKSAIGLAILLRFILIFSFPQLSDDIFRFIWDGRLIHAGINPYSYLPVDLVGTHESLTPVLYEQLNSKEYFSIYPPLSQLLFTISAFPLSGTLLTESIILKSFLFVCEVACLRAIYLLLKELGKDPNLVLIYALNPLVLLEIMGNVHFEGIMVLFLILAYLAIIRSRYLFCAILIALSVSAKLLTLMFVPALLLFIPKGKRIVFCTTLGLGILVLFFPLLVHFGTATNWADSLDLYMRKFEFNAGLYYILRWLGYQIYGYNIIHIIGPVLASTALAGILGIAWKRLDQEKFSSLIQVCFFSFLIFLVCSMTIHPWYLIMLLTLSVFLSYKSPIIWTGLIYLTYINYSYLPYWENPYVIAIEYLFLIIVMWWEWGSTIKQKQFFLKN